MGKTATFYFVSDADQEPITFTRHGWFRRKASLVVDFVLASCNLRAVR